MGLPLAQVFLHETKSSSRTVIPLCTSDCAKREISRVAESAERKGEREVEGVEVAEGEWAC